MTYKYLSIICLIILGIIITLCVIILNNIFYDEYTLGIENFDTDINSINELFKRTTIYASLKKVMLIINKKIIINEGDDGLNYVVISRDNNKFKIKDVRAFNIGCCRNSILDMINFISKIQTNDIIIVASKGNTFPILSNKSDLISNLGIDALHKIGAKTDNYRDNDSYILVTSKKGDIYYEVISNQPVYFPYIKIIQRDCKKNPSNILFPEEYIIFNDKSYDMDTVMKCAMESHMRGYNKFGLTYNNCIPMNDESYSELKRMENSSKCINEYGTRYDIAGYSFEPKYSNVILYENKIDGVIFYELENLMGRKIILNEGEHENIEFSGINIKSIYVPTDYFVILIKGNNIVEFFGPFKVDLDNMNNIDRIIVQKHREENSVICGQYNNKQICLTYGPGTNMLYPNLHLKILYVNIANNNKVTLYGDTNSYDVVQECNKDNDGNIVKIKFPRIIRSVKVE